MRLFQYWHTDPPPAIAALMDAAAAGVGDLAYVRHDAASARAFVAAQRDARLLAAWDALALPVMEADLLRLLLLVRHGGMYADATYAFHRPPADLLARGSHAQVPLFGSIVNGNYLMVRDADDAFLAACAGFVVSNIVARRFGSSLMATGPGAMNAVRCVLDPAAAPAIRFLAECNPDWMRWGWQECLAAAHAEIEPTPERIAALARFELLPIDTLHGYARSLPSPHRERDDHWMRWDRPIYR